jgi:hypothetical protein
MLHQKGTVTTHISRKTILMIDLLLRSSNFNFAPLHMHGMSLSQD